MINQLVSVIIPVYNGEEYLKETVDSVLNQSYKNFELILINDCSSDSTLKIINDYAQKDSRIVVIDNKTNQGRCISRNIGLDHSKGEYIAVLDADDISLVNRIEKQVEYLNQHPNIFLLGTGAIKIDEKGEVIGYHNPISNSEKLMNQLEMNNCIYHSSVMHRKTFIRYRAKFMLAEDYDFILQLMSENKNIANISDRPIQYRVHSTSATGVYSSKIEIFGEKAKEFYKQRIEMGKDEYESFSSEELLNSSVIDSESKEMLESQIKSMFKSNQFPAVRKSGMTYFKKFGWKSNLILLSLTSLLGVKIVKLLRKTIGRFF